MELEGILIRAESLFRRFQRTIETMDKKGNFPAPRAKTPPSLQRPGATHRAHSNPATAPVGSATRDEPVPIRPVSGARPVNKGKSRSEDTQPTTPQGKVISKELRELMSRKVEVLPRTVVRSKGEGLKKK